MEYMTIGEIVKAQGIKGEVKIKPLTDDAERFKKLKLVYVENKPHTILACRTDNTSVYLQFNGVFNRDSAELLRGKEVKIDRINAVALSEGRFFISDLIGCEVIDETGAAFAKITDVMQGGAADVITAKDEKNKEFRFPFLKRFFMGAEPENKRFVVNRKLLAEVSVYDD